MFDKMYDKIVNQIPDGSQLMDFVNAVSRDAGVVSMRYWLLYNKPFGKTAAIYNEYAGWCSQNNVKAASMTKFTRYLASRQVFVVFARDKDGVACRKYVKMGHCPTCDRPF